MSEVYRVLTVYLDSCTHKQVGVRVQSYESQSNELYGDRLSSHEFDVGLQGLLSYKGAFENADVTKYGVRGKKGEKLHRCVVSDAQAETQNEFESDLACLCDELKIDFDMLKNEGEAGFDILENSLYEGGCSDEQL